MLELLAALDGFLQEHRRCGELDGGLESGHVWMACDCGAAIVHPVQPAQHQSSDVRGARLRLDDLLLGPLGSRRGHAMNRRSFIGTLAGGLFTTPLAAKAYPSGQRPRIGYLASGGPPGHSTEAFIGRLRELGYEQGRTVAFEFRWPTAAEHAEQLRELAVGAREPEGRRPRRQRPASHRRRTERHPVNPGGDGSS